MKRILKVQEKIGILSKKSENPFFKSAYLDLNDLINAVQPLLHEEGLLLMQPVVDGKVKSIIFDVNGNKALVHSEIELPPITDPQKLGSCITYFRRYTLKSLLAIAEKDDDGNEASKPEVKKKLDDKGFNFLISKGTHTDINVALNTRTMTKEQSKDLHDKLETIETK